MQGKATIAGHPIHPMLVPVPIGFFVGALICDIVSRWGDAAFWPRMAITLVGFGIIGSLVAATAGFVDYVTAPMTPQTKRVATTHMTINLLVVAIFSVEFFVRTIDITSVPGYLLEILGIVGLGIAGYLGGELAFAHRVGAPVEAPERARTERGTIGRSRRPVAR